jgi:hypothetical protein
MSEHEEPPEWLNDNGAPFPMPFGDEPVSNVVPIKGMREGPVKGEPFRGLTHLPRVALLGRARVLELAAADIEYLWVDIVVAGTVVLIAGPPAEGKTTLLFLIIAARLSETPVKLLERTVLPARQDQYLILIEGEHSESSTSRKLVKSLKILNVSDKGLERIIIVARKAVLVGSPEWLECELMIAAGLVSDVAIDTLARVAPADANDESQQVAVFNSLAKAIERAPGGLDRPTVWAIAHTRKNGTDGGLGDVSGSVQRVGQADTVLLVKGEKVEGQTVSSRVTFVKLREDPDEYPKPVEFSIVKDELGRPYIAGKRKPSEEMPLEERVLALLRREARTKTWLATHTCRSKADIEVVITNLFDQRLIVSTDVEVGGRTRRAFTARVDKFQSEHGTRARDVVEHGTSTGLPWDELLKSIKDAGTHGTPASGPPRDGTSVPLEGDT